MSSSTILKTAFLSLLASSIVQDASCMDSTPKHFDEKVATILDSKPVNYLSKIAALGGGLLFVLTTNDQTNFLYNTGVILTAGFGLTLCIVQKYSSQYLKHLKESQESSSDDDEA